jgi:hypothetical protein
MFAGTFDRFESIKGLGIEAKARNLDRKIEEADEALQRLRELAELTCETVVTLSAYSGRINFNQTQLSGHILATQVSDMLSRLGSDQQTIQNALRPYAKIACWDAAAPLVKRLQELVDSRLDEVNGWLSYLVNGGDGQNPKVAELNSERTKIIAFKTSLEQSLPLPLTAFPREFIELFNDAPLVESAELEALRKKSLGLREGMESLSTKCHISDAEAWFEAVDYAASQDP